MKTMNGLRVLAFAALCAVVMTSAQAATAENGLGWNGLGWNGLGWNGLGWNGLGWNGAQPSPEAKALSQDLSALADSPLR